MPFFHIDLPTKAFLWRLAEDQLMDIVINSCCLKLPRPIVYSWLLCLLSSPSTASPPLVVTLRKHRRCRRRTAVALSSASRKPAPTSVERTLLTVRILGLSRDHDCREIQHIHQVQQGYTPNDQPGASYLVTAAAGSAGLAPRGKRICSWPILSPRSFAVTGIWVNSRVFVVSCLGIYAQEAHSRPLLEILCKSFIFSCPANQSLLPSFWACKMAIVTQALNIWPFHI